MDMSLDMTDNEVVEDVRKKQIEFYKTALKLYRGTRLSYEALNESMISNIDVPEELKTYEVLRVKIQDLQTEATQLQCLKDITRVIHNSLALSDKVHSENEEDRNKLETSVQGIIHFTRNIIQYYENKCNEIDKIEKSKVYVTMLENYQNHLERMKNSQRVGNSERSKEDISKWQKIEVKIDKINVMRAMKAVLLAKYANNHDRFPDIQKMRTPIRRNLTKNDFVETWNVGFRPS